MADRYSFYTEKCKAIALGNEKREVETDMLQRSWTEDTIHFYVPDFYHKYYENFILKELLKTHGDMFRENIRIGAVYGAFPGSLWNGGRVEHGFTLQEKMKFILNQFNNDGIPLRFTFTNSLITEEHLEDTFCNLCLKLADNGLNEVLVNSPILEEYIRANYPNYRIISSTTKEIKNIAETEAEAAKEYYMVVLDKSYNNTEKMEVLKDKSRYEVLLDSYCQDDCPKSTMHYRAVSKAQLEFTELPFPKCDAINRGFYDIMDQNKTFITVEDLYGKYYEMGYRNFKLDGRAFHYLNQLESYIYYMVKPEYQTRVRFLFEKALSKMRE